MTYIRTYRWLILGLLLGLTALVGINIKHLRRDAGISALVAEDHPDYVYSQEMKEIFGATDQVVVGVTAKESVYTPGTLAFIHELTHFFEYLEEIDEDDVISLTNVNDIQGEDGELLIDPVVDIDALDELDQAALDSIREHVRANPIYAGKLVSADEHSAVVIAGVAGEISMKDEAVAALKTKILNKLDELQSKYPEVTVNFSGPAMLKAFISEYMQKDMQQLFPFAILIVTLMLFLLLRSAFGMLVPILVTLFSIVWTFGLKGFLNSPLTIVETAIPVILIAIGCADGIHIISEFFGFYRKGHTVNDALRETMRLLTLPVILTSVTTGLGFVSLVTAPGVSIRNMGVFLAFGVMVAMVFSLLFIPSLIRIGRIIVRLKDMSSQRLNRLLARIKPYIAANLSDTVTVRYTNHYIRVVMMDLIIDSQIYSLLTVLLTITILMSVIFRSPVVGLITSLPVFIAVLFNFAVMWIFGVTLNVGTSIIASVGMGVGIDYTIHYFSRFRFILRETGDYETALIKAVAETSRPILSNASAVGLGFLVLLLSEYQVIGNVGWITALSMLTTAVSSLVVLPAILSIVRPKVKWGKQRLRGYVKDQSVAC